MRDFYEILGVQKNASSQEIKEAFKQKALIWHTDKLLTVEGVDPKKLLKLATDELAHIQAAFKTLKANPSSITVTTKINHLIIIYTYEITYYQNRLVVSRMKGHDNVDEHAEELDDKSEALEELWEDKITALNKKIRALKAQRPQMLRKKSKPAPSEQPKQPEPPKPAHASKPADASKPAEAPKPSASRGTEQRGAILLIEKNSYGTVFVRFINQQAYDAFQVKFSGCWLKLKFDQPHIHKPTGNDTIIVTFSLVRARVYSSSSMPAQPDQQPTRDLLTWIYEQYPNAPKIKENPPENSSSRAAPASNPNFFKASAPTPPKPAPTGPTIMGKYSVACRPRLVIDEKSQTATTVPDQFVDFNFKVQKERDGALEQLSCCQPLLNYALEFQQIDERGIFGHEFHLVISHSKIAASKIFELINSNCRLSEKCINSDFLMPHDKTRLEIFNRRTAILQIDKTFNNVKITFKDRAAFCAFENMWQNFHGRYSFDNLEGKQKGVNTEANIRVSRGTSNNSDRVNDLLRWIKSECPNAPEPQRAEQDFSSYQFG